MRSVQIYIEGERDSNDYTEIELFDDENIGINLSIQNIQDISKVFTDFSQSFTVPASSVNNAVFKHFYENAVDLDTTLIDQRLRRNAFIEIDRTPFRSGKIQLEKANLKDGQADSYTITFYGDLVTLKDLFGEDTLTDLDYSNVTAPYSLSDVSNAMTSTSDLDVRYPLISSDRLWSYGDSTSTDIKNSSAGIDISELNPAIKVNKVLEAIETTYGITFNGLFLSDKRFNDLFLWCNRTTNSEQIGNEYGIVNGTVNYYNAYHPTDLVFSATDNLSHVYLTYNNLFTTAGGFSNRVRLWLSVHQVSDVTAQWTCNILKNGVAFKTLTGQGAQTLNILNELATSYDYKDLQFIFSSDITVDLDVIINFDVQYYVGSSTTAPYEFSNVAFDTISISATTYMNTVVPQQKVSNFFSGILKQFNLTCYPLSATSFEIEPLDYWYQKGAVTDITDYVDIESIDVAKVPLYRNINFTYEDTELFLNTSFENDNLRKYGNLSENFVFDGGSFEVKLPFENMLFNKFTDVDLQVGYCLGNADELVKTKPILLYMYDVQSVPDGYWLRSGGFTSSKTSIRNFGQDLISNGTNYSLNWGSEISSLLLNDSPFSLYETYYEKYLGNLFNPKNRLTSLKAIFPTSLITSLELNDRLIIRDKRYIINNIKTDLTTGEVDLELINDFREISNDNPVILGESSGLVEVPILVPNGVDNVDVTTASTGVTLGATTNFTSDGILEVNYSANPNQVEYRITEDGNQRITENFNEFRRSEQGDIFVIELDLENIYTNGDVTNTQIYLIQEA
jgi:hypothetical protein